MDGGTPLIIGVENGRDAMVQLLLGKDKVDNSLSNAPGTAVVAAWHVHSVVLQFFMQWKDI